MNVQCLSCSSRYSVPDAKVQGRKVRIKCKRCGDPILIDGTHLGRAQVGASNRPGAREPSGAPAHLAPAPLGSTGKKQTMIGMPSALHPGRALHPGSAPARAAAAQPQRAPKPMQHTLLGGLGAAPATASQSVRRPLARQVYEQSPAPVYPPAPWTVAVTEEDQRELTTDQVVALYAVGTIDEGTYVWRDGMDDWCSPFEAPDLRRALEAARISPRDPIDDDDDFEHGDEPIIPSSPLAEESAPHRHPGMWHEPGRLGAGNDPGFEDVTVSMNEKETEGLLRQARRADFDDEPTVARGSTRPNSPFAEAAARGPASVRSSPADAFDFDDEEVTRAISTTEARAPLERFENDSQRAFELSQRKSTLPPPDPLAPPPAFAHRSSAPPVHQESRGESSVAFSLEALTRKSPGTSRPPPQKARTQIGLGPAVAARQPPRPPARKVPVELAPALVSPSNSAPATPPFAAPEQNVFSSHPPPPRAPSPIPVAAPPNRAPLPASMEDFEIPDFARPKRRRWPVVAALLLLAGGAAASFYAKQPMELWAQVHHLSGGQFPTWPELNQPTEPQKTALPATANAPAATAVPAPPKPTASAESDTEANQEGESDESVTTSEVATKAKPKPRDAPAKQARRDDARPPSEAESDQEAPKRGDDEETAAANTDDLPEFDRSAAAEALGAAAASASSCKSDDGPTGRGRATVTFANSGRATNANVTGTFAGTSVGGCVAALFRQARVPAFSGPPVKVAKSFSVE